MKDKILSIPGPSHKRGRKSKEEVIKGKYIAKSLKEMLMKVLDDPDSTDRYEIIMALIQEAKSGNLKAIEFIHLLEQSEVTQNELGTQLSFNFDVDSDEEGFSNTKPEYKEE